MAALNRNYVASVGTLVESFDTLGDWTSSPNNPTQLSAVTTNIKEGTAALKVVSTGSSNNQQAIKTISADYSTTNHFHVWVYVDRTVTVHFGFSSQTSFSAVYMNASVSTTTLRAGYWNLVKLNKSDFTATGGESWSNTMIRMRVRVVSGDASEAYAIFDEMRSNMSQRAKCIVNFDSATASMITRCLPIMQPLGIPGTLYVQSDLVIGNGSALTIPQLQRLQTAGWDLASHSKTHPNFTEISLDQVALECRHSQDFLIANGFTRASRHFAYPEGATSDDIIAVVDDYYDTARITTDTTGTIPVSDPYRISCLTMKAVDVNSTAIDLIDEAINEGRLLMLMYEGVADSNPTSEEVLTSDFKIVMQYLHKRSSSIDAVTLTQFMAGISSPRRKLI